MTDFLTAELARFDANPIAQTASWIALLALFGFGVSRPFIALPVVFQGTAKLLQFIVIGAIAAVACSAFQSNIVAHMALYIVGSLVVFQISVDNWKADPNGMIGFLTTFAAFNGFFVSLAGEHQSDAFGAVSMSVGVHVVVGIFVAIMADTSSSSTRN